MSYLCVGGPLHGQEYESVSSSVIYALDNDVVSRDAFLDGEVRYYRQAVLFEVEGRQRRYIVFLDSRLQREPWQATYLPSAVMLAWCRAGEEVEPIDALMRGTQ